MAFFDDIKDVIHEAKTLFPGQDAGSENMNDNDAKAVYLNCPYCGAQNKIIWREGALPKCPSCGGEYDASQVEEQRKAMAEPALAPKIPWHRKFRIHIILVAMMLIMTIFAAIYLALGGSSMSMHMDSNFEIHIGETSQP